VATLSSGECFGELALLDRGLRAATVTANRQCSLSRIMDDDFRDLLERCPSIAIQMLAILARRNASLLDR
jgi:CRP-like cAMP-binding protein